MLDEVGDRRRADSEASDDPEAVDVGQRLVDIADPAQFVGLVDDGGDGRANAGG